MENDSRFANWSNHDILKCCRKVYFENEMTSGYTRQSLVIISSSISFVWFVFFVTTLLLCKKRHNRNKEITNSEIELFFLGENNQSQTEYGRFAFTEEVVQEDTISNFRDQDWDTNLTLHKGLLLSGETTLIKKFKSSGSSSALKEIKALMALGDHPNIQRFFGVRTVNIVQEEFWLFFEYCENWTLSKFLKEMKVTTDGQIYSNIEVRDLNKFAFEIASGMEFISNKNIVHRDLSADNVFLTDRNVCKIGDFSLSRKLDDYVSYQQVTHAPLPWRHMSPETLKLMTFSVKSDVWSFGITIWEIFSFGARPYGDLSWDVDFFYKIEAGLRPPKPELSSKEMYDIMTRCWNLDADSRPTFKDLTEFFSTHSDVYKNGDDLFYLELQDF